MLIGNLVIFSSLWLWCGVVTWLCLRLTAFTGGSEALRTTSVLLILNCLSRWVRIGPPELPNNDIKRAVFYTLGTLQFLVKITSTNTKYIVQYHSTSNYFLTVFDSYKQNHFVKMLLCSNKIIFINRSGCLSAAVLIVAFLWK